MTQDELSAVVRGVAPVVRETVTGAIQDQAAALGATTARVAALEADRAALADLRERLARLEGSTAATAEVAAVLGAVRERVAVVEARAPVPGPPGPPGFRLEDFAASFDGERTLTLTCRAGDVVKSVDLVLPLPHYEGTYHAGAPYTAGAMVTWEGSLWLCREATSAKPLEGAKTWTLIVKRGRDGRDGKDAPGPAAAA
jgi:hypothetical protein